MKSSKQVWALAASVLQLVAGLGHLGWTWNKNKFSWDLFWLFLILLITIPGEAASLYYSYRTDEVSALPDVALALAIMWLMFMEVRPKVHHVGSG